MTRVYEDLIDPSFAITFTLESVSGGAAFVLRQMSGTLVELQFNTGETLDCTIEDAHEEDGLRVYDVDKLTYREFPWNVIKGVVYQ